MLYPGSIFAPQSRQTPSAFIDATMSAARSGVSTIPTHWPSRYSVLPSFRPTLHLGFGIMLFLSVRLRKTHDDSIVRLHRLVQDHRGSANPRAHVPRLRNDGLSRLECSPQLSLWPKFANISICSSS